jgi:hypothetical protein
VTLFALYRSVDDPTALPVAVSERFSWFAALLPPVHALVHRLWDQLAFFIFGLVVLVFGARYVGADATLWLYIVLAIACGFAAPGAQRRAYRRRGLVSAGHRIAPDADLARLAFLEARP